MNITEIKEAIKNHNNDIDNVIWDAEQDLKDEIQYIHQQECDVDPFIAIEYEEQNYPQIHYVSLECAKCDIQNIELEKENHNG